MKLIRKLFTKISRPSLYTTCMIVLIFVAIGLYTIFSFLAGAPTAGFICLFISAIFLGYGAYAIIILVLKYWPRLEKWSEGHKYINKFVMNYDFRTICTTVLSMAINLGFAAFNAIYGFMYMEWWCISLFIYYIMLIIMRSSISTRALRVSKRFDDDNRVDAQLRVYRMAAIMLLVFTVALNFLLWELLSQEDFGFRNHLLITIVTGIYTIIKVILAVGNLIYTRGRHDKITHAVRNINMADALVSVMTLLMTLLTRFSDSHTAVMTVRVLGTIICIYVSAMAVFMLVNSIVKIKKNRRTIYEMLMDSLNEDFESSLEEPAWEAVYATTEYASVGYTVDEELAGLESDTSVSDGVRGHLENSANTPEPLIITGTSLDPDYYSNIYDISDMGKPIPSAPFEDEYDDEPTPLPAALMPHNLEDDGLDDDHHIPADIPAESQAEDITSDAATAEPLEDTAAIPAADTAVPEEDSSADTSVVTDITEEPAAEEQVATEPAAAEPAADEPVTDAAAEAPAAAAAEDAAAEGPAEQMSAAIIPAETAEQTPAEDSADNAVAEEQQAEDAPADAIAADEHPAEVPEAEAEQEVPEGSAEQAEAPAEEPPAEEPAPAKGPVVYEVFTFYTPKIKQSAPAPAEAAKPVDEMSAEETDFEEAWENAGKNDLWIETETATLDEDELYEDEDADEATEPDNEPETDKEPDTMESGTDSAPVEGQPGENVSPETEDLPERDEAPGETGEE